MKEIVDGSNSVLCIVVHNTELEMRLKSAHVKNIQIQHTKYSWVDAVENCVKVIALLSYRKYINHFQANFTDILLRNATEANRQNRHSLYRTIIGVNKAHQQN